MRTNPDTSIEAYRSLQPENIREVYQKIINALSVLKAAHTEDIAAFLKVEHCIIHKRVSEMERKGILYKPGAKKKMKSGRRAYVWSLTKPLQSTAKIEVKIIKHRKPVQNNQLKKLF